MKKYERNDKETIKVFFVINGIEKIPNNDLINVDSSSKQKKYTQYPWQ